MERKSFFVGELKRHYEKIISGAHRAESNAAEEADLIREESTRKEDTKSAIELARLASAHRKRRQEAKRELETLIAFAARRLPALLGTREGDCVETVVNGRDREWTVVEVC